MAFMMSQILRNTNRSTSPDTFDGPLDLSLNKYPEHTCDNFVNHDDLRKDVDAAPKSKPKTPITPNRGFGSTGSGADGSNSECSSGSFDDIPDRKLDVAEIKREVMSPKPPNHVHPFSIEALIGDASETSPSDNSPSAVVTPSAIVTSKYDHVTSAIASTTYAYQAYQLYPMNCHQPTPTSGDVTNHVSYWCHVCHILCTDTGDVNRHVNLHLHQKSDCSLRKSLFRIHGYVSRHRKLDEERMQCGICEKVVALCFFARHQRLHNGHVCDVCNKEFSSNSRLQDHMNVHTGATPFTCKICDRSFAKRTSLTQHHRYHRDHNGFKCSYCNKSFNSKYTRSVHERLHTGENPFKCTVPGCTRAFPQKVQLKLHMASHKG